jgi:hypothetical protein
MTIKGIPAATGVQLVTRFKLLVARPGAPWFGESRRQTLRAVMVIALAGIAIPAQLSAQTMGGLHGRVLDMMTDVAVAAARVELLDSRQRRVATALSDSAGAFRVPSVRPGEYVLRAEALGYRAVTTPTVQVAAEEATEVIVRLGVDVVSLAPLEILARPQPVHREIGVVGFMERGERRMGGVFIMREEIEERQPDRVSELLRMAGGFTILDGRRGPRGGKVFNNRSQRSASLTT